MIYPNFRYESILQTLQMLIKRYDGNVGMISGRHRENFIVFSYSADI